MTFSEFAKIIHIYCNASKTEADFIIRLVDKIMDGQPGRAHQDGTYQNPMRGKDDRTLINYYNGNRSISKQDASTIYSHINLKKFERYIDERCSLDAQMHLLDDLQKMGEISGKNLLVPEICAKIFEKILRDLAK